MHHIKLVFAKITISIIVTVIFMFVSAKSTVSLIMTSKTYVPQYDLRFTIPENQVKIFLEEIRKFSVQNSFESVGGKWDLPLEDGRIMLNLVYRNADAVEIAVLNPFLSEELIVLFYNFGDDKSLCKLYESFMYEVGEKYILRVNHKNRSCSSSG